MQLSVIGSIDNGNGRTILALDSEGRLLQSTDDGETWVLEPHAAAADIRFDSIDRAQSAISKKSGAVDFQPL